MATGDQTDMLGRIKALIPRWFGDTTPILDSLLSGLANAQAFIYGLIAYAALQTRIATATDGWLDMIAADFFGIDLQRSPNETDDSYRARILGALFQEKATRNALVQSIRRVTGRMPIVIELTNPVDCGAYGVYSTGYSVAGAYGSIVTPYTAMVIALRASAVWPPANMQSIPPPVWGPGGYGVTYDGSNTVAGGKIVPNASAVGSYANQAALSAGTFGRVLYNIPNAPQTPAPGTISTANNAANADVFEAVERVRPVGTTVWLRVVS